MNRSDDLISTNRSDGLISVLREDHYELRQLLTELENLCGGEPLRRTLTDQLIVEVVRHAVAEECYLYPLVRERLPDGDRVADEALADHGRLERLLRRLEAPELPDDQFALLMSWLIADARQHIDKEDQRIFPLLAHHVSERELIDLGKKAQQSKSCAPSRASDKAGGRPLVQALLRSGAGLVGRVREYLCGHDKAYPGMR
jgi:hemerythrin-like domain-containing protein